MKKSSQQEINLLCERYPQLLPLKETLLQVVERIAMAYQEGHTLLVCGNGGSASDSLHITGELMKSFSFRRPISNELAQTLRESYPQNAEFYIQTLEGALPTISLVNEISLMTAYANDQASNLVFAQQVVGYGKKGAVLFAISTSGNSENILHAARIAKAMGMTVISLTGESGGALRDLSDLLINVPVKITYQVQELHLPVYHAICLALEHEFFGEAE
jgi:D-sedoheptulose 7-phosphate isomerase